jgi:FkbM family methyltransferase
MMKQIFSLGKVVDYLPRNNFILKTCKRYVDHCYGENNDDMARNGEMRVLRETMQRCKVVFDVGANIGDWAENALSLNPKLKIHCFEPCADTFQLLETRTSGGNVKLNHFGLSDSTAELQLYKFDATAGTNSVYLREGLEAKQEFTETVQMNTLDNYCQKEGVEHIEFLKLDVEGHELAVFKGAASMLKNGNIDRIQFEYGGCNIDSRVLLKDLFELLSVMDIIFLRSFQSVWNLRNAMIKN